jgi:hypothetical protein
MLFDFKRVEGYEILHALHAMSLTVQRKFNRTISPQLHSSASAVSLHCASFLDVDWSDGGTTGLLCTHASLTTPPPQMSYL